MVEAVLNRLQGQPLLLASFLRFLTADRSFVGILLALGAKCRQSRRSEAVYEAGLLEKEENLPKSAENSARFGRPPTCPPGPRESTAEISEAWSLTPGFAQSPSLPRAREGSESLPVSIGIPRSEGQPELLPQFNLASMVVAYARAESALLRLANSGGNYIDGIDAVKLVVGDGDDLNAH